MRYSFTGPSRLTPAEETLAMEVVAALDDPAEITTGAADGWDTAVCHAALSAWPDAKHRIVTPGAKFNLMGVNAAIAIARQLKLERFEIVTLPSPENGGPAQAYRDRNRILVTHCEVMVAAVRSAEDEPRFYRSGEWMTANLAAAAGRRVDFVRLAPS